jgi:hypothetical protein
MPVATLVTRPLRESLNHRFLKHLCVSRIPSIRFFSVYYVSYSMTWPPVQVPLQAITVTPRPLPTWADLCRRSVNYPLESGLYIVSDAPESKADIIFVSNIYCPLVNLSTPDFSGYRLASSFTSFGFRKDEFWLQRDIAPRVRGCRVLVYHFPPTLHYQVREEAYKLLREFQIVYPNVKFLWTFLLTS